MSDFQECGEYQMREHTEKQFGNHTGIVKKKKLQLNKFEDLIGFMKQFMNRAASHPASREMHPVVVRNGKLS